MPSEAWGKYNQIVVLKSILKIAAKSSWWLLDDDQ